MSSTPQDCYLRGKFTVRVSPESLDEETKLTELCRFGSIALQDRSIEVSMNTNVKTTARKNEHWPPNLKLKK